MPREHPPRPAALAALLVTLSGCSTMLPMSGDWSSLPQKEVDRIMRELPGITEAAIRDTRAVTAHKVKVPCFELMQICYPGLPLYAKLLGSIPLACTQTFQHAWRNEKGVIIETEKTSLMYSCWMTPAFVMDHELRHTKGENHALF